MSMSRAYVYVAISVMNRFLRSLGLTVLLGSIRCREAFQIVVADCAPSIETDGFICSAASGLCFSKKFIVKRF